MKVLVECCHDTALVRYLGVPIRRLGHVHGKGNVLRLLAKWDGEVVGVVDADTGKQSDNNRELPKYREEQSAYDLMLLRHHADERKSLVVIIPKLEDWLLARAAVVGIRASDYGLPETARAMHKSPRYDLKPGFRRFLGDLAAGDDGMKMLKKWLTV